jgi:probable rRNA maturation factor
MIKFSFSEHKKEWQSILNADFKILLDEALNKVLKHVLPTELHSKKYTVGTLFTGNKHIAEYNLMHRGKNMPTNVLSFPHFNLTTNSNYGEFFLTKKIYLGDMIFALEIIQKEAVDQEKILQHHLLHLFVHSILHLLGFDHIQDDERHVMEQLEVDILMCFNVQNPYN